MILYDKAADEDIMVERRLEWFLMNQPEGDKDPYLIAGFVHQSRAMQLRKSMLADGWKHGELRILKEA